MPEKNIQEDASLQAWQVQAIQRGIDQADAGLFVDLGKMDLKGTS